MPRWMTVSLTQLSCLSQSCALAGVALLLSASAASAQAITANGTTGPVAIYRGDVVSIHTPTSTQRADWVGLYTVGAAHGSYLAWYYLNGTTTLPPSPISPATFPFRVVQPAGSYEFRYFANNSYTVLGTSGVITVQPATLTVHAVAAPQTVHADPRASLPVAALGGNGQAQDWVAIYRVGAADTAWLDWVYLNGTRTVPNPALYSGTFAMAVPNGRGPYEVRWFAGNTYTRVATSGPIVSEVRTLAAGGAPPVCLSAPPRRSWPD